MGSAESRRYVLKRDGLGYSLHLTQISKNSSMYIHYKNHQESCLCVEGSLEIEVGITVACPENTQTLKSLAPQGFSHYLDVFKKN